MDWLPSLLKHFGVSKAAVGALFAASAIVYFGPRFFPDYVDPAPREWAFLVVGTFVFTAVLLLTWSIGTASKLIKYKLASAAQTLRSRDLDENEAGLLHVLGQHPTEPLNLDRIDYSTGFATRLEVLNWVDRLERKGLVRKNRYSSELISLTDAGRRKSLEIQQASD